MFLFSGFPRIARPILDMMPHDLTRHGVTLTAFYRLHRGMMRGVLFFIS